MPHVVVTDAAAPGRIAAGEVDAVLVGADRVAAERRRRSRSPGRTRWRWRRRRPGSRSSSARRRSRSTPTPDTAPRRPRGAADRARSSRPPARASTPEGTPARNPVQDRDARGARDGVGQRAAAPGRRGAGRSPSAAADGPPARRAGARGGRLMATIAVGQRERRPRPIDHRPGRCCAPSSSRTACSPHMRSATSRTASSAARTGASRRRATRSSPSASSTAA